MLLTMVLVFQQKLSEKKVADAFDRFESFDKATYDAVFASLVDGSVELVRTFEVADANGYATAEELTSNLGLSKVSVSVR